MENFHAKKERGYTSKRSYKKQSRYPCPLYCIGLIIISLQQLVHSQRYGYNCARTSFVPVIHSVNVARSFAERSKYSFTSTTRVARFSQSYVSSVAAMSLTTSSPKLPNVPVDVNTKEIRLPITGDMMLAAQTYNSNASVLNPSEGKTHRYNILCLHGWMDNSASFHSLAPRLAHEFPQSTVVALDLVGHGQSDHLKQPPVVLPEAIVHIHSALQSLGWISGSDTSDSGSQNEIICVGHSMGAALSCVYAATFPENVSRLVLLDGGSFLFLYL